MNFFWFSPSLRTALEKEFNNFLKQESNELTSEFLIPEVLRTIITTNQGTAKVIPTESVRFGVTNPEDKEVTEKNIKKLISEGKYPQNLRI
jgi:hypothetical protein